MYDQKEVFFHIGLGKVASTYLQYEFFSKLKAVHYVQRTKYPKAPEIIKNSDKGKFLISREFDRHRYIVRASEFIAGHFPNAKPILLLRRHDSWIASQYRRYAKNGYPWTFSQFFDIRKDQGQWKKEDLLYFEKIELLEKYFNQKPLVLFYDEMKDNPLQFMERLANYMGTSFDPESISLSRKHISYSTKQMKATLAVGRRFNIQPHIRLKSKILDKLRHFYVAAMRYTTLYGALLIPKRFFSDDPLIPQETLNEIRRTYEEDWQKCLEYARKNNLV